MPKFKKTEDELKTLLDKWLFVLSNLSRLMERPVALQERVFTRLFEQAEIARYTPEEQKRYYDNYKAYRDIHNAVDTARNDGREEGIAVGREEGAEKEKRMTARRMFQNGMDVKAVSVATGLSNAEIQRILNEMNSESGSV